MTVSYFVRYEGRSDDPDAFYARYATEHAGILRDFPGLRSLSLHRPLGWTDPFPVNPGGIELLAQMTFDSADALNRALASEARARAREDFAKFPRFEGQVFHQAMKTERLP